MRDSDDTPYRSPHFRALPEDVEPSSQDEEDYSTLQIVRNELRRQLDTLGTDFNSFNVLESVDPAIAAADLLVQVKVKKEIHSFLMELIGVLDGSLSTVDAKSKANNKS